MSFKKSLIAVLLAGGFVFNSSAADEGKIIGKLDGQVLATGSGRVVLLNNDGSELWTARAGNCHDVWKLDNGNVLVADGEIREIDPKTNKVVFNYKSEMNKGFFHLYIDIGNEYGSPNSLKHFDSFYAAFSQKGLAKKGTLVALSRGGLDAYGSTRDNTDKRKTPPFSNNVTRRWAARLR